MGTEQKVEDEVTKEKKVQRLGLIMTDPPDYFVAQINSPSAGSPKSSCSAEEEGFRFSRAEVVRGK